jgi:hypothetical protein
MNEEEKLGVCYGIAFVVLVLIAICISSGVFGGQSDLEVFKAYVEGVEK